MFGTEANFNPEGSTKLALAPAIYENGEIIEVKKGSVSTKDENGNEVTTPTLVFTYVDSDGNKHEDIRKKPSKDTGAVQLFETVLHVASRYLSEAEVNQAKAAKLPDWDSFINWAIVLLGTRVQGVKIKFKVVGDVYNGNAFTKIPNFSNKYTVPFIQRMDSNKELSFTSSEKINNAKFFNSSSSAAPAADTEGNDGAAVAFK